MTDLLQGLAAANATALERALEQARYFVGIDLGTTNSTVAVIDAQAVLEGNAGEAVRVVNVRQETLEGATYSPFVASVVAEVQPSVWWVGQGAKDMRRRGLLRGKQIFYSTKSEMGLGREPFYPLAASPEYDTPYKVAGRILQVLKEAIAEEIGEDDLDNLVVTVPASFQLAARRDTFKASELAGWELAERALLDEPNAALLDYLLTARATAPDGARLDLSSPRTVLVFDFGGGTCDVSVLRVRAEAASRRVELSNLAVARYEQLGGDNIDAAIVEQVLLPKLLEQNGIDRLDLSWSDKKHRLIPQLLGTAEALKLGVCAEYQVQQGLREEREIDRSLGAAQPSVQVDLPPRDGEGIRSLILDLPSLTLAEFDRVLAAFLDADFLHARDTEVNAVRSVFGPIEDAIDRAGLEGDDIDAVLLAGGSSLIPHVSAALSKRFPGAALLRYPDEDRSLFAVARGAALHSFFLHALGAPLLKPIAQESIGVLTQGGGFAELIPRGTELPHPADGGFSTFSGLTVPRDLMREVQIVLAAEGPEKVLGVEVLRIDEVKSGGEPIELRWRIDANKLFEVEASLTNHPAARCEVALENPLCATGFRSERHRRIVELEEQIVRGQAAHRPRAQMAPTMEELASLQYEEGRYEKAIEWARHTMKADDRPSPNMLNLTALCYDELGSVERAEKHYREAMRIAPGSTAVRFNLALLLERQDQPERALELIDEAVRLSPTEGAYRVQRGCLLKTLGRSDEARESMQEGAARLDASSPLNRFQRVWRIVAADALGDKATAERLRREASSAEGTPVAYDASKLPTQQAPLARTDS